MCVTMVLSREVREDNVIKLFDRVSQYTNRLMSCMVVHEDVKVSQLSISGVVGLDTFEVELSVVDHRSVFYDNSIVGVSYIVEDVGYNRVVEVMS